MTSVTASKMKKIPLKKQSKSVKKKTSISLYQRLNFIKTPVIFFSILLLVIFLIINIISSQTVSPLYFSVLNENKSAVIVYLKKIVPLPFFQIELDKYKAIYGNKIEQQVFAEKTKRQQQIITLEMLLQKNPQARNVLFTLYQLYLTDGQTEKAQKYLKKAQQIDPMIETGE